MTNEQYIRWFGDVSHQEYAGDINLLERKLKCQ
jgi:hypothetical protein